MGRKNNRKVTPPTALTEIEKNQTIDNSLAEFAKGVAIQGNQVSQLATLFKNNRYNLLFNNRMLLGQLYVEHGLIQSLIDQPVDDAFRTGLEIITKQLDEDEIKQLQNTMENDGHWRSIVDVNKWSRLFGGGGLVIMSSSQSLDTPFNINRVKEFTKLEFYDADLWELNLQYYKHPNNKELPKECPYQFYGQKLHESMVLPIRGKKAPSLIRPRFRGWGMTEVERLVRSFNQFLKNQDVVFELLDEAKVDIYKIAGFNNSLLHKNATDKTTERVQLANMVKSYLNAIVMDVNDEFDQKTMAFSGLGDILTQIRQGIASDLKMPITKLFGVSSSGFNSGEDDIENYNSMVESEVRSKTKPIIISVLEIVCMQQFGFVPDDLEVKWKPLRILSAKDEEDVKDKKSNRILSWYSAGLVDPLQAKEAANKDNLLSVQIEETDETYDNPILDITPTGGTEQ